MFSLSSTSGKKSLFICIVIVCVVGGAFFGLDSSAAEAEEELEERSVRKTHITAADFGIGTNAKQGAIPMTNSSQQREEGVWDTYAKDARSNDPFMKTKMQGGKMKGFVTSSVEGLHSTGLVPDLSNHSAAVHREVTGRITWLVDTVKSGFNISGGQVAVPEAVTSLLDRARSPNASILEEVGKGLSSIWSSIALAGGAAGSSASGPIAGAAGEGQDLSTPPAGGEGDVSKEQRHLGLRGTGPGPGKNEWELPNKARGHGGAGRRPGMLSSESEGR